jgi:hypothetical protein
MGNTPNETLGEDPANFPPSNMTLNLNDFEAH